MNEYLVETLLIIYHCIHATKCLTLGKATKHEKSKRNKACSRKVSCLGEKLCFYPYVAEHSSQAVGKERLLGTCPVIKKFSCSVVSKVPMLHSPWNAGRGTQLARAIYHSKFTRCSQIYSRESFLNLNDKKEEKLNHFRACREIHRFYPLGCWFLFSPGYQRKMVVSVE